MLPSPESDPQVLLVLGEWERMEHRPGERTGLRPAVAEIIRQVMANAGMGHAFPPSAALGPAAGNPVADEEAARGIGVELARSGRPPESMVQLFAALRVALGSQARPPGTPEADVALHAAIDRQLALAVAAFAAEGVRVRDLFMAGIAHELRGPLSALRLSAAYLARVPQTPELTKASARISTSASRLKSLVDDLVEFSHWRLQELVLERRPLDLGPWLAGELDPLRLLWPARELHLELHGPMQGDWDERRLRQVLGHLVEFGCAAGEPAEPVTVRVNGSAQDVVLSVSRLARLDDEAGSESAFDPLPAGNRVFDPKAIALALPLTRTIARAHGGDAVLQFESPRVTLVVRLPR